MYPCSECHRTYRTQNSLTRHAHSHRSDNKHQCATCGVIFYRKDLLTRHSKLHQTPSNASARLSMSSDDVDTEFRRQRCHTACDRCRDSRTKCDGHNPCSTCSRASLTCHYTYGSNRLSCLPRDTETGAPNKRRRQSSTGDLRQQQPTPSTGEEEVLYEENNHLESRRIAQHSPDPEQTYRLDLDCSFTEDPLQTESSAHLNIYNNNLIDNTVTWPWLHEDLFLSTQSDIFALPLDPIDDPAFRTAESASLGIESPHAVAALFPGESFHVRFDGAANPCGTADITTAAAASNEQNDTSASRGIDYATAVSSAPSTSRGSRLKPVNPIPPAATPPSLRTEQNRVVQDLVAFAAAPNSGMRPKHVRTSFWDAASAKVAYAFRLPHEYGTSTGPSLYRFCNQYLEDFAPLWPLLCRRSLEYDALHPALFLVLTSIGAMYCGSPASDYGAMMHTHIRGMLTLAIELEDDDHDFVWLAQARLLTQVAALYFGQPKAFTYAHHLGALLVAQARRNNLFSATYASGILRKFHQMKGSASDEERLGLWLQLETRRRLAFGIFRGDTYTSTLLHTKPLISMEEIDLWVPTCDAVWRSENLSASLCLEMIEHDQTPSRELWASDIFRIAMDRHEALPPLSPAGQELLMFGLQYPTWRFSKDRQMFARLTGDDKAICNLAAVSAASDAPNLRSLQSNSRSANQAGQAEYYMSVESEAQNLESVARQMEDLEQERQRLLSALSKWEQTLPLLKSFVRTNVDRSSLMSSLILFHLGFIRLLVPLEELHQIQYRMADKKEIDDSVINTVRNWARSHQGRTAAERACNIWNIIQKESEVEESKKVRFNLLAFIGLHHSAVVLWAYASYAPVQDSTSAADPHSPPLVLRSSSPVPVEESQSTKLLSSFVRLYDLISPAKWSSFAKAASMLSNHSFPRATDGPSTV